MATRRVKRIRRTKKQVHRARGRKTNYRRRHHTRRQRGGAQEVIIQKTYGDGIMRTERNAYGIDIVFDPITGEYRIGSGGKYTKYSDLVADTYDGRARYSHAVEVLKKIGAKDTVLLSKHVFNKFVDMYCAAEPPETLNETGKRIYSAQCVSLQAQKTNTEQNSNKQHLNCVVVKYKDELVRFVNSNDQSYSTPAEPGRTFYFFRHFLIPLYDDKPPILCDLEFEVRPNKTLDFKLTKFESIRTGPPVHKRCIFPKLVARLNDSPSLFTNVRIDGNAIIGTISNSAIGRDDENVVFDFSTLIYTFRACDFLCEDGDTGMDPATEKLALDCLVKVGEDKTGKDRIFNAFAQNNKAELNKILGEYTPSMFDTLKKFFLRRFGPDKLAVQMSGLTVARRPPSSSSSGI